MHRRRGWVHAHGAALVELLRLVDAGCIAFGLWWVQQMVGQAITQGQWVLLFGTLGIYSLLAMHWPLYRSWRNSSMQLELRLIAQCWIGTACVVAALAFVIGGPGEVLPRELALAWCLTTLLLLLGTRIVLRLGLRLLRLGGRNFRRAAIVGSTDTAAALARQIQSHPWMGVRLDGVFDDRAADAMRTHRELPTAGTVDDLMDRIHRGEIDLVYLALPLRAELRVQAFMARLRDSTVTVMLAPDLSAFGLLRARWEVLGGIPLLSLVDTPHEGVDGVAKRLFDIAASSLLLLLLALPLLLVALAIRLESPGPVIFRQPRYGLDGREFRIFKFRSMRVLEDGKQQFSQARKGDSRITRVGAFIRRTSIDELPQLLNVLEGSMSLVGPRPHPVALNEAHRRMIDGYMLRHKVKPGITGWAQVHGFRGETDTPEKMEGRIRYDLEYIETWTRGLDLRILWRTLFRVLDDPNAY
jgi:putative colanic acid biosysnthesis UDP-glucose lipid carrier transferase